MGRKTVIVSFDMEPDIGFWTNEMRGVSEGTPEILRVLAEHRVPATFLWTGTEARNYPKMVHKCLEAGHEVGCHTLYHEKVGEPVYAVLGRDFVRPEELPHRLELATAAVQEVSGERPVSFRAPCLFGSTALVKTLQDLGYVADSSHAAYYTGKSFLPYHPSDRDWTCPGDMKILEMPPFYDTDLPDDEASKQRHRDQWPMLRFKGAEYFTSLCRRMIAKHSDSAGNCTLVIYLHPWEFIDGMPQGIDSDEVKVTFKDVLSARCGRPALDALSAVLGALDAEGVVFTRMKDFAARPATTSP